MEDKKRTDTGMTHAWIRNRKNNEMIASLDKPDGEVKLWIAPTKDDPAQTIPSDRDDGYEQIVWHGVIHLVQSIDIESSEGEVAKKLAAIDRRENEEAWREQAPKLGIHPDMFVKKSEREALGFYEEDRFV